MVEPVRSCAFLTMEDMTGFVSDDHLAVEAFGGEGWRVDWIPWTADADWAGYEAVLIRSTWDYYKHLSRFVTALKRINADTRLFNSLEVVEWNARKSYLRDLQDRGVRIVPTQFARGLTREAVGGLFSSLESEQVIVKPLVSAGADSTFLLHRDASTADRDAVLESFCDTEFMAQPFVTSVLDEGEYSLFYFGGLFSHAVVKTPKPLDFRVQEEHGGMIRATNAGPDLKTAARDVLSAVGARPLYARIDLVRGDSGAWLVMEVELIEPSLYLRTDPDAAHRFARAFGARMRDRQAENRDGSSRQDS